MYTPDYKMVGDGKYVGAIKENNKVILISNEKKNSAADALRHAEEYIREYYLQERKNKVMNYRALFWVAVMLTVFLFFVNAATPKLTEIGMILSVLPCVVSVISCMCFGIMWSVAYQQYNDIIDSFDSVVANYFENKKTL